MSESSLFHVTLVAAACVLPFLACFVFQAHRWTVVFGVSAVLVSIGVVIYFTRFIATKHDLPFWQVFGGSGVYEVSAFYVALVAPALALSSFVAIRLGNRRTQGGADRVA